MKRFLLYCLLTILILIAVFNLTVGFEIYKNDMNIILSSEDKSYIFEDYLDYIFKVYVLRNLSHWSLIIINICYIIPVYKMLKQKS